MSALGPGCVKTLADFRCMAPLGLGDLSRWVFRFWGFVPLVQPFESDIGVCGMIWPDAGAE
jgi:hypothetical protein